MDDCEHLLRVGACKLGDVYFGGIYLIHLYQYVVVDVGVR